MALNRIINKKENFPHSEQEFVLTETQYIAFNLKEKNCGLVVYKMVYEIRTSSINTKFFVTLFRSVIVWASTAKSSAYL